MGFTNADVELINSEDIGLAKRHIIGEKEIGRISVNILLNTGADNLCIDETIQSQLELPFLEKRKAQLANGHIEQYDN